MGRTFARGRDHGVVRKLVAFVAVWLVAAGVAVAVAWQGVGIVTRQVTDDRPAPWAAAEVEALAQRATPTREAADEAASGPDGGTFAVPTTSAPTAVPGAPAAPGGTATTTTTPAPTPAVSPGPTGTASSPATAPSPVAPTTTAAPPAPATSAASETRTYHLVGGSASLRFTPEGVTVLWATPNAGFAVDIEQEGAGVQVDFESDDHRSRVDAWWDGGPQEREREDPR